MIKEFIKLWEESTTYGKVFLVVIYPLAIVIEMSDKAFNKWITICNRWDNYFYAKVWLLKKGRENYERRNSNKS